MKTLLALLLVLAAPLAGAAGEPVTPQNALKQSCYFGSSSASLTNDGYAVLRAVAAAMKADPRITLEVQGHADTSAAARTNVPLAQARADAAREFLMGLGIEPGRLVAKGYGAYRPLNDNDTLERRSWNRRVQFRRTDTP
jgi:OmpA-OmpF porin, OOP family